MRRITTTRDPEESDNGSAHLRSPPPHPLTRAIGTYTVIVQAGWTVGRTVIEEEGTAAEGCRGLQSGSDAPQPYKARHLAARSWQQEAVAARELFLRSVDSLAWLLLTDSKGTVSLFLLLCAV